MIKVRVDWHSQCPGCGTQLALDFFGSCSDSVICPWCGYLYETDHESRREELRQYLQSAIKELENDVNAKIPV